MKANQTNGQNQNNGNQAEGNENNGIVFENMLVTAEEKAMILQARANEVGAMLPQVSNQAPVQETKKLTKKQILMLVGIGALGIGAGAGAAALVGNKKKPVPQPQYIDVYPDPVEKLRQAAEVEDLTVTEF